MPKQKYKREWCQQQKAKKYRPAYEAFIAQYPFTINNLDGEKWKPITEDYHASNFGRIKSFKHGGIKILRPALNDMGYLRVNLFINGKQKTFKIHRLIAELFVPNPDGKPEVNHLDGVKFNCHVSNLEWVTGAENNRHAYTTGLIPQGECHYKAKLKSADVIYIRDNPDSLTCTRLAKMFGVNVVTVSDIQRGKKYSNAGGTIRERQKSRVSDDVRNEIRQLYKRGSRDFGSVALAKQFGVTPTTIRNIINE